MRFSHGAQTSYIYFKRIFEKIAFHISFQILSPIGRRSNAILRNFCPLRGVKMIFFPFRIFASCWISSFSHLGIFVPDDDIFPLQNFCLLLAFFIFLFWVFLCLKMIFFPFIISASCWISSFSYLGIFVPQDDILSLQNFRLLLDFFILVSRYFCA